MLVRVAVVSVNPVDWMMRSGTRGVADLQRLVGILFRPIPRVRLVDLEEANWLRVAAVVP